MFRYLSDVRGVSSLARRGLRDVGWLDSRRTGRAVDAESEPIPWFTYAAIHLVQQRVAPHFRVFEYGAGGSTAWWAHRVATVTSVEHDPTWFDEVSLGLPANAAVLHRSLDDGYAECIRGMGPFEVIVIDGRHRVACSGEAVRELSDDGVIIWDDTDRERYQHGLDQLEALGFRRLDLWGFTPVSAYLAMTTILYRDRNCFGI